MITEVPRIYIKIPNHEEKKSLAVISPLALCFSLVLHCMFLGELLSAIQGQWGVCIFSHQHVVTSLGWRDVNE